MSTTTQNKGPVSGVVHSVTDLAGDVLEIVELQVRLAQKDAKEALSLGLVPLIAMGAGMSLMVAALPVLAFALATFIHNQWNIPDWVAQLGVAFVMIALAIVMSFFAFRMLKKSLSTFGRSMSELTKNIAWLNSMVRRDRD